MIWFWLILAGIMLAVELATTALVSIWFVAGALLAAAAAAIHLPIILQVIVFGLVSALLFFFCREQMLRHFSHQKLPSNTERLIQETGTVSVPIEPDQGGRIQVAGQDWKAITLGGTVIPAGAKVRVVGISGVKLEVIPELEEASADVLKTSVHS